MCVFLVGMTAVWDVWVFDRELRDVQCEQPHVLSFLFQAIAPLVAIEIFLKKTIYVFQSVVFP